MLATVAATLMLISGDLAPEPPRPVTGGDVLVCQGERTEYNDGRDMAQWYSRRSPWRGRLWLGDSSWRFDYMATAQPVRSRSRVSVVLYDTGAARMTLTARDAATFALQSTDLRRPDIQAVCAREG